MATSPAAWTDMSNYATTILTNANQSTILWTVILGFIIAFVLAFAVGANDVANAFGTTVGANVLSLKSACILATIFETLGAVFLGAKVGETIRKGIIDVSQYNTSEHGPDVLMIGEVSAMAGAAIWQLFATVFGLPVSGTHSIVGACIGFSLVAVGASGINWKELGLIIASWFVSPVLSGFLSVCFFYVLSRLVLFKKDPLQNGLRFLPLFYAFTIGIIGFSVLYSGAPLIGLDGLPIWSILGISIGTMVVIAIFVQLVVVPRVREKALKGLGRSKKVSSNSSNDSIVKYTASTSTSIQTKVKIDSDFQHQEESSGYKKVNSKQQNKKEIKEIVVDPEPRRSKKDSSDSADSIVQYTASTNIRTKVKIVDCEYQQQKKSSGIKTAFSKLKNKEETKVIVGDPETKSQSKDSTPPGSSFEMTPLQPSRKFSYDGDDSDSAFEEDSKRKVRKGACDQEVVTMEGELDAEDEDPHAVRLLFSFLQIITSCFGSFAHGGNDVSNAIGPLIALWLIYNSGNVVQRAATPWYLLLYGGAGIVAGLWILGRRVIQTIGKDLTKITPSRGFCIEVTSALTVLLASNIGIPVSTTHCKVGSIVAIGWFRSQSAVQWSMVRNIAIAWFVTVPVSGLISAGVMYLLMKVAL